jgi:hypothetical protein
MKMQLVDREQVQKIQTPINKFSRVVGSGLTRETQNVQDILVQLRSGMSNLCDFVGKEGGSMKEQDAENLLEEMQSVCDMLKRSLEQGGLISKSQRTTRDKRMSGILAGIRGR